MSRLQRLSFGMNKAEDIAEVLDDIKLTNLMYLNLRKAKMSPTAVGKLSSLTESNCLETVVLDGVKLAGSGAIRELTGRFCIDYQIIYNKGIHVPFECRGISSICQEMKGMYDFLDTLVSTSL